MSGSALRASADPKASLRGGLAVERKLVAHFDRGDSGAGRSFVAPRDSPGDGVSISFEHRFHAAVGKILHPTVDAGSARFVRATLAEPHVLHAARHPEVPPDRQTWHAGQENVDRPPTRSRTMTCRQRRQVSPSRAYTLW